MSFDKRQREQIHTVLNAMLSSQGFANSQQLQNFLRFIVTRTLDGEPEHIKGYTIGVDALGKPESFDPQADPSVRVMAGRLRQAITNFNREEALAGFPTISLPKGSYVPTITFNQQADVTPEPSEQMASSLFSSQPGNADDKNRLFQLLAGTFGLAALLLMGLSFYLYTSADKPGLALPKPAILDRTNRKLPVVTYNFQYDKNSMPTWISPALAVSRSIVAFSRFHEYRVIPKTGQSDNGASDYDVNVFFSDSLTPEKLDVYLTLYRSNSGEVLWSDRLKFSPPEQEGGQDNLSQIESIVSGLLSPYGIIYGDILNRNDPPPRLDCIRKIYDYFSREDLQSYSTGVACARSAVSSGDASSSMYAMLTFLYVEAYRRNILGVSDDPLSEAREFAVKAIELNEANARAYQARFAVEKTSGNMELAIRAAERAVELNPLDRDILGDFAAYLTSINQLEKASGPLRRASELTPSPPAWLQFYQYLHADLTGNHEGADKVLATSTRKNSPLLAVAKILSFERGGEDGEFEDAVMLLQRSDPDFLSDPENAFLRRGFSDDLASNLAARIEKAKLSDRYTAMDTSLNG